MTTLHECPDCKNLFVQPFKCITCGAEKLYDTTVRQGAATIDRQAALLREARELLILARHSVDQHAKRHGRRTNLRSAWGDIHEKRAAEIDQIGTDIDAFLAKTEGTKGE